MLSIYAVISIDRTKDVSSTDGKVDRVHSLPYFIPSSSSANHVASDVRVNLRKKVENNYDGMEDNL